MALAASIRRHAAGHGSAAAIAAGEGTPPPRMVCLVTPGVPPARRALLRGAGWRDVVEVPEVACALPAGALAAARRANPDHDKLAATCTKLLVFGLGARLGLERVLFLDADAIVVGGGLDALLRTPRGQLLPAGAAFAAAGDSTTMFGMDGRAAPPKAPAMFNTGVFFARPSLADLDALLRLNAEERWEDTWTSDQDLFNAHFGPIGAALALDAEADAEAGAAAGGGAAARARVLPTAYNMLVCCAATREIAARANGARVLHFSVDRALKPWEVDALVRAAGDKGGGGGAVAAAAAAEMKRRWGGKWHANALRPLYELWSELFAEGAKFAAKSGGEPATTRALLRW